MSSPPRGLISDYVVAYRQKYPCMQANVIASKLHVSRERVRQILKREGLVTDPRKLRVYPCLICGEPLPKPKYPGKPHAKYHRECYRECYHNLHWVQVACDWCGTLFPVMTSQLLGKTTKGYDHLYCSRSCKAYGTWRKRRSKGQPPPRRIEAGPGPAAEATGEEAS